MATAIIHPDTSIGSRTVVLTQAPNRADWDRFVQQSPHVIAWHGYEWSEVLKGHYGTEFYPLAVYEGANIVGILPLYRVRGFRGDTLMSVPYFVAGGIAAEAADVQTALLNKAIAIAHQLNISKVILKQYKLKLSGLLSTDENYYNRELTLSRDLDQIWKSISPFNQARIEESRRYNLQFEYPSSDVTKFYRLLLEDQHRAGVPCVGKAWVQRLFDSGMYEIALLRHSGQLVAATMVKKFRDTVSFPFTCIRSRNEKDEVYAYALYWRLLTTLGGAGIRIAHSGRIPKTDQTFRYRLGWGGTKYDYYYQYYGLGEGKTEFSTKRGRKREIMAAAWRNMPVSMARALGPIVVKQFP